LSSNPTSCIPAKAEPLAWLAPFFGDILPALAAAGDPG
jgi:hypothetical protein